MKALHYVARHRIEWRSIDAPRLAAPTDALVRPRAVAACDLDRLIAIGRSPFPGPFVLGHEFCGEVVAVGDAIASLRPGDRVVASFQPSCGTCPLCVRGHSSVCASAPRTTMFGIGAAGGDWGGALADLVRVPWASFNLRRIPAGIDPVAIASGPDNLLDGLRTVDQPLSARPGASVLIAGRGSIPLYAALCARHFGAGRISFASDDPFALDTAARLGAESLPVDQWPKRFDTHDITVDCTNHPAGLAAVVRSTAPFGTCTSVSIYFAPETPMPLSDMYMKGIEFHTGRVDSAAQLDRLLALVGSGLDPNAIDPAVVAMDDAPEAFTAVPFSRKLVFTA
jgi:alcohol dehydrogenase